MKTKIYTFILTSLLLTSIVPSKGIADLKIATVDTGRLLNESVEAKTKRSQLNTLSQDAQKKIDVRRNQLKELEAKLRSSGVGEDSKEALQFRSQARDLQKTIKDAEDDLRQQMMKMNKSLTDKTVDVIRNYAQSQKIDLVLDKSSQMQGPVLFGAQPYDITDQILQQLNKQQ